MKHKAGRRWLSLLLNLVMLFSLFPAPAVTAFAAEIENQALEPEQQGEESKLVTVAFVCDPADTEITVREAKDGGETVDAGEDGTFALPYGEYTYSASLEGYVSVEDEPFTVGDEDGEHKEVEVILQQIPADVPVEELDQQPAAELEQQPGEMTMMLAAASGASDIPENAWQIGATQDDDVRAWVTDEGKAKTLHITGTGAMKNDKHGYPRAPSHRQINL